MPIFYFISLFYIIFHCEGLCVNDKPITISKCCENGKWLSGKSCVETNKSLDLPIYQDERLLGSCDEFDVIHGNFCVDSIKYRISDGEDDKFLLQANGSVYFPSNNEVHNHEKYCIETFLDEGGHIISLLMCMDEFDDVEEMDIYLSIGKGRW